MVWEPDTIAPPSTDVPPIMEVAPGFPVEFDDPAHAGLDWGRDGGHMPDALTPLAGDYARVVGSTLNSWQRAYGYPHRWLTDVWHGFVYYALEPNATPEEWAALRPGVTDLCRELAEGTEAAWRDEVVPEVRSIYSRMDAVDVEGAGEDVAGAWESSWLASERAWELHSLAILGLFQALQDLADAYKVAKPDAPAGEAYRLILGSRHELFEMDLETERLIEIAAAAPAVSNALRTGVRSLDRVRDVAGGPAFATAFEGFLQRHGHLGQSADDLAQPSWAHAPEVVLDELAKRLNAPPPPATERRERLRREADALAADARASLADQPDELARFDRILDLTRRIGPLSEVHNYWIDRAVQAHLRSLVLRVGRRMAREGVIAVADDVFYLRRTEVADLLRAPKDVRGLVAERRRLHARQREIMPAPRVGSGPPIPMTADRPEAIHPELAEAGILRGTGASPGIVRGTARVVSGAAEFGRIAPGDIIVCQASNPSWVPVLTIAGGLITNLGGVLSHAAVVAREFGVPAVVGVRGATTTIADGRQVEIDGTAGVVRLL